MPSWADLRRRNLGTSTRLQAERADQRIGVAVTPRFSTRSRACDVELGDAPLRHELHCLADSRLERGDGCIEDDVRASELETGRDGECRPAARRAERDDQRAITVLDVPSRTLVVACAAELRQRIARRNDSIFSLSALRTPAAAGACRASS